MYRIKLIGGLGMLILTASELSLEFGDKKILDGVSFSVNEGDRLGIIGVNGAGKTSLIRLITKEYTPSGGSVFIAKEKSVGCLQQNVIVSDADGAMSVIDYMYSAFGSLLSLEGEIRKIESALASDTAGAEAERLYSRLNEANESYSRLGGLEFRSRCRARLLNMGFTEEHLSLPVSSLSGGQHTRLSLARLLATEPDLLILDEPTNHLDVDSLFWLESFISQYKKTVIIISHDRYFLDKTTNKTLQLRYGKAQLYHGSYSRCKEQQQADAAALERKYKAQQLEIAKIKANIDFQRRCGQEHNFVTIRAKEKQLARMEKIELAPAPEKNIRIAFDEEKQSAGEVLRVRDLSVGYGTPLFSGLNFTLTKGERLFFLGDNGCGKSTLIKVLMGRLSPLFGRYEFGYNIKIGYFDQENSTLCSSNTVFEEMRSEYPTKTDFELRSALALFLFGADDIDKKISELSGGERARVTLAKLMLKKVNLLIMDEPTNHLDIGSREALEVALTAFDGTVIAVSHDRYFIDSLATRILELSAGGAVDFRLDFGEGAFSEYMRLRNEKRSQETPVSLQKQESEQKLSYQQRKDEIRAQRMLENKKKRAEEKIAELEAEQSRLKDELFSEAASDYVRASEIDRRITEIDDELLKLYEIVM